MTAREWFRVQRAAAWEQDVAFLFHAWARQWLAAFPTDWSLPTRPAGLIETQAAVDRVTADAGAYPRPGWAWIPAPQGWGPCVRILVLEADADALAHEHERRPTLAERQRY